MKNNAPFLLSKLFIIESFINILAILGVVAILIMATVIQIFYHEIPCPLCLLQRTGYLAMAIAFLLNLHFGFRPSHYALVLLSGLFTSFVALRQIALHVIPGTGMYGSSIFGFHLYTWSFISSMAIVSFTAIILGIDRQYSIQKTPVTLIKNSTYFVTVVIIIIAFANALGTYLECGLSTCPDNPENYEIIDKIV